MPRAGLLAGTSWAPQGTCDHPRGAAAHGIFVFLSIWALAAVEEIWSLGSIPMNQYQKETSLEQAVHSMPSGCEITFGWVSSWGHNSALPI